MRKVLATALVALMVASSVFAGFSGSFETQYKADFAGKNYGFLNGTTNKIGLTFDKVLKNTENENPVYGKLAAEIAPKLDKVGNLNLGLKITEASVNGENWSVDIMKMAGIDNYAGGFISRETAPGSGKFATQNLDAEVKTTNGVTAVYDGWTLGLGMNIVNTVDAKAAEWVFDKLVMVQKGDKYVNAEGTTKDYEGAEPAVVATYKNKNAATGVKGTKEFAATFKMKELAFVEDALKLNAYVGAKASNGKKVDLGFGAKVAFVQDKISASVASDMVLNMVDKDSKFNADVAANFAYDFVNAGVYYATKAGAMVDNKPVLKAENLLDVQVGFDLKSFDVPLAVTVAGTDLINDGRGIMLSASSAFMEGAKVSAEFGMDFDKNVLPWTAKVAGEYTIEDIAKLSASVGLGGNKAKAVSTVSLNVAAENTTLLDNTTLKLAYSSANFLEKDKAAGALTASCAIKF